MEQTKKESPIRGAADFLSTFLTALIVMIAILLVGGRLIGIHLFNVESGSMTPVYPVNALVIVKETDPEKIEEGDVITYVMNEEGTLVTHRVISIDESQRAFTTKGDANNVEDAAPVLWGNLVGKVLFGVPGVGLVFARLTAAENRVLMIGIIVVLLLLSLIWDLTKKKPDRRKRRRKERGHE